MLTVLFLVVWNLFGVILQAVFLRWGAKWARSERATLGRSILVIVMCNVLAGAMWMANLQWVSARPGMANALLLLEFAAGLATVWGLISVTFRISYVRAVRAWLPTLLAVAIFLGLFFAVIRPYVSESFSDGTNSMAPTIDADHRRATCAACGGRMVMDLPLPASYGTRDVWGVCETCRKAVELPETAIAPTVYGGDHFMVAKWLKPRRWDILAFKAWRGDSLYIKRVVGLPGETIEIVKGRVVINGVPAVLPAELATWTVEDLVPATPTKFAAEGQPLRLGADEYFVLGDATTRSMDSRLMGPVAEKKTVGVVTVTYSPLRRMRIFR